MASLSDLKNQLTSKGDKRDSGIEKVQKELLLESISRLSAKYGKRGVRFDMDGWNTRKNGNKWFLDRDGSLKQKEKGKYNPLYSSKTFDATAVLTVKNKTFRLYFILKGVENEGGHQTNVGQELGLTSRLIQKFKGNNSFFFFVLDGSEMDRIMDYFDECEKYFITNSNTIEEAIESLINKNLE